MVATLLDSAIIVLMIILVAYPSALAIRQRLQQRARRRR